MLDWNGISQLRRAFFFSMPGIVLGISNVSPNYRNLPQSGFLIYIRLKWELWNSFSFFSAYILYAYAAMTTVGGFFKPYLICSVQSFGKIKIVAELSVYFLPPTVVLFNIKDWYWIDTKNRLLTLLWLWSETGHYIPPSDDEQHFRKGSIAIFHTTMFNFGPILVQWLRLTRRNSASWWQILIGDWFLFGLTLDFWKWPDFWTFEHRRSSTHTGTWKWKGNVRNWHASW